MDYIFLTGTRGKLSFDFEIERRMIGDKIKWFQTTTKKAKGYIERTPFNKGNLWKVRKYMQHYDVYFGTKKVAYCTNLESVIKTIKHEHI